MTRSPWISREPNAKFTVREVAQRVNRTPQTIYRWIDEGFLKNVIRVRDGYLIPGREIERIEVIVNPER